LIEIKIHLDNIISANKLYTWNC